MMSSAYLATGAVIESKNSVCAIKLVQTIHKWERESLCLITPKKGKFANCDTRKFHRKYGILGTWWHRAEFHDYKDILSYRVPLIAQFPVKFPCNTFQEIPFFWLTYCM